jgi:hypothetical protein
MTSKELIRQTLRGIFDTDNSGSNIKTVFVSGQIDSETGQQGSSVAYPQDFTPQIEALVEIVSQVQQHSDINTSTATIVAQVIAGAVPGPGFVLPVPPAQIVTVPETKPLKITTD